MSDFDEFLLYLDNICWYQNLSHKHTYPQERVRYRYILYKYFGINPYRDGWVDEELERRVKAGSRIA